MGQHHAHCMRRRLRRLRLAEPQPKPLLLLRDWASEGVWARERANDRVGIEVRGLVQPLLSEGALPPLKGGHDGTTYHGFGFPCQGLAEQRKSRRLWTMGKAQRDLGPHVRVAGGEEAFDAFARRFAISDAEQPAENGS